MPGDVTFVICTRNRAQTLGETLAALELPDAKSGGDALRVVVVDNGSTDHTRAVAEQWASQDARFGVVREPWIGLSAARNRGAQVSTTEYTGYLDDECRPSLFYFLRCLEWAKRGVDGFGGPYCALYRGTPPDWFTDRFASRDHGDQVRVLSSREYLFGANMIFRTSLLRAHPFSPEFGMAGDRRWYGEETDLQLRLRSAGAALHYDPELMVPHLVLTDKLRLRDCLWRSFQSGRSAARVYRGPETPTPRSLPTRVVRAVGGVFWETTRAFVWRRAEEPSPKSAIGLNVARHIRSLGSHLEEIRMHLE